MLPIVKEENPPDGEDELLTPALAKTPFGRDPVEVNPETGLLLLPIDEEENPPDGEDELLTAALAKTPLGLDPVKTDELTPGLDAVVNM